MSEPTMMVSQNLLDNSSSAEKMCSQLDTLVAQQQRLQNDICQVKSVQSGMKATLDSVQNILMSINGWSPGVKPNVDDPAASIGSLDVQADDEPGSVTDKFTRYKATFATDTGGDIEGMSQSSITPFEPIMAGVSKLQASCNSLGPPVTKSIWGRRSVGYLKEFHFGRALSLHKREELGYWADNKQLISICQSQSTFLIQICESHIFQACIVIVILANTMFMVYEEDLMMSNVLQGKQDSENALQVANWVFCILFSIELGLKLAAYRCRFFWNEDWKWNVFDLIVVATAVNDQIQTVLRAKQHMKNQNLGFLRVLRALKMVRMLRIFRLLKFLREIRLLVENIMGSMKSLLWASTLIAMVNFVFGLVFLQASASFLRSNSEVDTQLRDSFSSLYGSTIRAMLTMYMSTTGGMDWEEAAEPLLKVGYFHYLLFIVYISFSMFVVSNVVTSMFVDTALQASSKDAQYLVAEHLRKKQKYLKTVQEVFERMEKNPDGSVSVEAFTRHLHDTAMVAFCEEIEVEPADLEQFFMALSDDGKHTVDLDTFVVGCIKLRGNAKSADMMEVLIEINKANHGIHSLLKRSRDSLTRHTSTHTVTSAGHRKIAEI